MEVTHFIYLLIVLVIVRHIVLVYAPHIILSGYLAMFIIGSGVAYMISKSYYIALFIGLVMVYGRLIYRYTTDASILNDYVGWKNTGLFVIGILAIYALATVLGKYQNSTLLQYVIFIMVVYLFASLLEWVLHKYIMHCYMYFPWLDKVIPEKTSIPYITTQMKKACTLHHDHHKSVNKDMSLKEVQNRHELIFDWPTTFMFLLVGVPLLLLLVKALRIDIHWKVQTITLVVVGVYFSLVWNSIHPTMHDTEVDIPLTEGPPNLNIKMDSTNIFYRNHDLHHQVKGLEKGNYNVIFLGADELLQTNRMV